PGDVLRGGIEIYRHERLAGRPQGGDERILPVEKQAVIDALVEKGAQRALDLVEIRDHSLRVQLLAAQRHAGHAVVPVQAAALARIVEQAVAVAERQLLRDAELARILAAGALLC